MALSKIQGAQIETPVNLSDVNVTGVSTHDGVSYFTNNVFIDLTGGSTVDAVRINQSGTGNALLIEDQSRPDSSPFVIDTNGDVGIGTTIFSSGVRLSVLESDSTTYSTISYGRNIELTNGSPGGYSGISFVSEPTGGGNAGRSSIISYCDSAGNSNLVFGVRKDSTAVERVRISSDGYIGVNTAIPGAPFEIRTTDQNPEAIKLYHSVFNSGSSQWGIDFMRDTNFGVRKKSATIKASRDGSTATSLIFATSPSDDGTSPELERLRINYDGKVGIGSTIPAQTLDVRSNDTRFNLTSDGSGQTVGMTLKGGASDGFTYNFIESVSNVDSQNWYIGGAGVANNFVIKTAGTERLRVDSNGRLGINTDNYTADVCITNGAGPTLQLRRDGGNEWFATLDPTGASIKLRSGSNTDAANRVVAYTSGRIGILTDAIFGESTITVMPTHTTVGAVAIGGSVSLGSGLKASVWDGAKSSYATNGGLDIYVGNGSHALTVWDDNVSIKPRFEVTRNGIVHHYFQPAFYARKTTSQTFTTTPTTIVFSTEEYDIASNYDTGTSRFTAPADGRYYIHAHYLPNVLGAGGPSLGFTVYVNGSGVPGANDSLFSEAERQTRSIDVILSLNESDYVEIKGSCSSGTHGVDNSGVFCGVKVG